MSVVARAQKPMEGAAYEFSHCFRRTEAQPVEEGEKGTRRAFLVAAGAAGLCYTAALAYPVYRYLASPEEMASNATAVKEVSLKDAQKLPAGSVLMFKFGTSPAMLIHHQDGTWASLSRRVHAPGLHGAIRVADSTAFIAPVTVAFTTHTPAPTSAGRRPSHSKGSMVAVNEGAVECVARPNAKG